MHDLGFIATSRTVNGKKENGFEMYVGGGLGAVPYQAKLLEEIVPFEEILPMSQAVARVFARLGEKKNRNRARIKFLVKDLGIEKFRELVLEERKLQPEDPRWTAFLNDVGRFAEQPLKKPGDLPNDVGDEHYARWLQTNTRAQRQEGFVTVTVSLPLGDITPKQLRDLADLVRKYTHDTIRTSVEQNFVLRWISKADLPALYEDLKAAHLASPEAHHIEDIVACPGTDTCKLGISSSRGLAAELRRHLAEKAYNMDEAIKDLHIKISGCFNSCGQQHVADMGFYGVGRKVGNYMVPHFQMVLGGQWENNGGAYGLPVVAIPSKNVPAAVDRLAEKYLKERQKGESFKDFIVRAGKVAIKNGLEDLLKPPSYEENRSFYSDWGDPREYTTGDVGTGECAGEVVALIDFDLAQAEREAFEAQVALDEGKVEKAGELAYWAMLHAAKGLVKTEFLDVKEDPATIVGEFRKRFYDTEKFFDPFAGGKFAQYLFMAHDKQGKVANAEAAYHAIEEAGLFIEATHSCNNRLAMSASKP
jgi:sulfite reductase (ferredoxin)